MSSVYISHLFSVSPGNIKKCFAYTKHYYTAIPNINKICHILRSAAHTAIYGQYVCLLGNPGLLHYYTLYYTVYKALFIIFSSLKFEMWAYLPVFTH